jgi:hypothetical protein
VSLRRLRAAPAAAAPQPLSPGARALLGREDQAGQGGGQGQGGDAGSSGSGSSAGADSSDTPAAFRGAGISGSWFKDGFRDDYDNLVVNIQLKTSKARILPNFLGTSHEWGRLAEYAANPGALGAFANIFRELGPSPVLRIGGRSQEVLDKVPSVEEFQGLAALGRAANLRFIIGLPLERGGIQVGGCVGAFWKGAQAPLGDLFRAAPAAAAAHALARPPLRPPADGPGHDEARQGLPRGPHPRLRPRQRARWASHGRRDWGRGRARGRAVVFFCLPVPCWRRRPRAPRRPR